MTSRQDFSVFTSSGRRIHPFRPLMDGLTLTEIGTSLSRINRFAGAAHWSVAQHSVLVMRLIDQLGGQINTAEARLWALLHDAHEAIIGDIPTPAAELLGFGWRLMALKHRLDRALWSSFTGAPFPDRQTRAAVKFADQRALELEIRGLDKHPRYWRRLLCDWEIEGFQDGEQWVELVEDCLGELEAAAA